MKKIVSAILLLFVALSASAEFRWGPTAGVNISTLNWKQDLITTKYTAGVNAGLMGEIMIPGIGFGVDFGLKYALHGAKVNFGEKPVWSVAGFGNETVNFHTLQIPVNLRFKWTRMDGFERYVAPFVYAGPVFTFNLSTSKLDCIEHPEGSLGIQCGIGGEFYEHLQLSMGYLWGLSYDVRTVKLDNFSARNQGWQINLAWLF
ncbi:MAG: PorT family protein [Muribaculaceae bacterium]|nr:PorT family protein [Muribaculaceae bacterium]